MADDLDIPAEAVAWIEVEARAFFDSGGVEYPRPQGLEAAEIHAFYDLAREDARSSSSVMLAALTRTLGGSALPAVSPGDGEAFLARTVGSAGCWPQLGLVLETRGSPPTVAGLRAWQRDDAQGLREQLTRLGLKVGHRQRIVAALEEQN